MKIKMVRRIVGIAPKTAPGRNNLQRRFMFQQRTNLNGRGLRTQKILFVRLAGRRCNFFCRKKKCVLLGTRRMIFGGIEGVEAEPFRFKLRAFGDRIAELFENTRYAVSNLCQRMQRLGGRVGRRQGRVDRSTEFFQTFARLKGFYLLPDDRFDRRLRSFRRTGGDRR